MPMNRFRPSSQNPVLNQPMQPSGPAPVADAAPPAQPPQGPMPGGSTSRDLAAMLRAAMADCQAGNPSACMRAKELQRMLASAAPSRGGGGMPVRSMSSGGLPPMDPERQRLLSTLGARRGY